MKKKKVAPYGTWKSPITADLLAKGAVRLSDIKSDSGELYWLESKPSEGGRCVVVQMDLKGKKRIITPKGFNVRTRVHEYGGGSYMVHKKVVYFSNYTDQRMYRQVQTLKPEPITPIVNMRYADAVFDTLRHRIICVREDHTAEDNNPVNTLVSLNPEVVDSGTVIASGYDFYSSPRISPNGQQLAWLCWKHPNMPWDATDLWVASINHDGSIKDSRRIAGGPSSLAGGPPRADESIFQPEWSPDGTLHFVSDRTGWWNIYKWNGTAVEPLCPIEAEFGMPAWVFGASTYAFVKNDRIVCACNTKGTWKLGFVNTHSKRFEYIKSQFTEIACICVLHNSAYFIGGSPELPLSVVQLPFGTLESKIVKCSSQLNVSSENIPESETIQFPTSNRETAYALYYAPKNQKYTAAEGKQPPLIVKSHGGPTSAARTSLSLEVLYWTTRGFGVVDVNYRGSTGYGRAYRQALYKNWGVYDVDDCENAAIYLAKQSKADSSKLFIRGGSAGGYTTLSALTFRKTFKAGASYYGVCDLEILVRDTHKFESRYLDKLIGPYPQDKQVYHKRSPIHYARRISCPVIIFQGLQDKVVPPNQAEMIYKALLKKGLPVEYITFKDEQHGFRCAENIKRALEAELRFYLGI